jgi:hypothetical protein
MFSFVPDQRAINSVLPGGMARSEFQTLCDIFPTDEIHYVDDCLPPYHCRNRKYAEAGAQGQGDEQAI